MTTTEAPAKPIEITIKVTMEPYYDQLTDGYYVILKKVQFQDTFLKEIKVSKPVFDGLIAGDETMIKLIAPLIAS